MRKFLFLALFLALPCFAQQTATTSLTTSSVTTSLPVLLTGTGTAYHILTWNVSGTVSACSVQVDTSSDGNTWTAGGAIASQTCTSNGQSVITNVVANYIRINVTSFSGTGSVTTTWYGYVTYPGFNPNAINVSTLTFTGAGGLTAGGTNRNITLTPSGTGSTILNGNVGIGTTAPSYVLDITGSAENLFRLLNTGASDPGANQSWQINIGGAGNYEGYLKFLQEGATSDDWTMALVPGTKGVVVSGYISSPSFQAPVTGIGYLSILSWTNTGGTGNGTATVGEDYQNTVSNIDLVVGEGSGSYVRVRNNAGTEFLRLTYTGNVGIGTSTPGVQLQVAKAMSSGLNSVTFSATPTFDASLGNTQEITLAGNVTSSTLINAVAGEKLNFIICQNATGGYTFAWPSQMHGAMTIGTTASKCSAQSFIFDGTNAYALTPGVINQ